MLVKPMAERTAKRCKEMAWQEFARFIRLRDCLQTTQTIFQGICFTCNRKVSYKELQAGHFIAGRHNAQLFDEVGVHGQCEYCNIFLRGNTAVYTLKMLEKYGKEEVQRLIDQKHILMPYKKWQWIEKYEEYKAKADALISGWEREGQNADVY